MDYRSTNAPKVALVHYRYDGNMRLGERPLTMRLPPELHGGKA